VSHPRPSEADAVVLAPATARDVDVLEPLVGAYHTFEHIESDEQTRRVALSTLIADPGFGQMWRIDAGAECIGYIAITFGYTIEFGGRDAFIDEFFITEAHRGRGIGRVVLDRVVEYARHRQIRALHLEVARDNSPAARLYEAVGFRGRDRYHLMTCDLAD